MEVKEEKKGNVLVFSLKGRLDSNTSPEVEKKILAAIEKNSFDIVLDFSALDYLSSAGIRLLVHAHKQIEKHGGLILLSAVPKEIENILYITGFLSYFKIFETQQQALDSLAKMKNSGII